MSDVDNKNMVRYNLNAHAKSQPLVIDVGQGTIISSMGNNKRLKRQPRWNRRHFFAVFHSINSASAAAPLPSSQEDHEQLRIGKSNPIH